VTALPTDVTDRAQIAAAKIDGARLGPVAVPMCNAGREGGGGILSDENVWRRSGSKADKDSRLRFRRRHAIASGQQTVHEAVTSESWPGGLPDRSAHKHDFAGGSWLKNFLVCARGLGEWQFLSNDRTQRTVFEACKNTRVDVCLFFQCNSP
jgi:hypothetical protein